MKKILFLIHDLGQGGAEKVLVNLVNNLNREEFDITVLSLFAGGVNEQFLSKDITYITIFKKSFPANSTLMKLFSPQLLHSMFIHSNYDIEVSYLEGPSARIISGCTNENTKMLCWVHSMQFTQKKLSESFRSIDEAIKCYSRFDCVVGVSKMICEDIKTLVPCLKATSVLYNTIETEMILDKAKEPIDEIKIDDKVRLISVGSLKPIKGFDRLFRVVKRLKEDNLKFELFVLGTGPLEAELKAYIDANNLNEYVFLLGYQVNPYRYLAKSDLYVCSSLSEGFSTAVTEAMICGNAICTVDVSGMREMLGDYNEYGIIVRNDENDLYEMIRCLIKDKQLLDLYKRKAKERSVLFNKQNTVEAVQKLLEQINDSI